MEINYQPRIRVFAGPNGSGKSKLKSDILSTLGSELIGVYINPDEIEKIIRGSGYLDLKEFKVVTTSEEIIYYFCQSALLKKEDLIGDALKVTFNDENQKLGFSDIKINSYFASVISDFIRNKLLERNETFSFETVISSPDKIEFLKKANRSGYKTYVYFISTYDPGLNISRVKKRVRHGGHNVSEDKIRTRYYRSLDLMEEAIKNSWRAYVFDNSKEGGASVLVAEANDGDLKIKLPVNEIPEWFNKYWIGKNIFLA